MNAHSALQPLLSGNLAAWQGLPLVTRAELDAAFGPAREDQPAAPWRGVARRLEYPEFSAWTEGAIVCMVQPRALPAADWLARLALPTATLDHEMRLPGGYVHELLYLHLGLVLSAWQASEMTVPSRLVRCRGFAVLPDVEEYLVRFHHGLDDQWRFEFSHAGDLR